VEGATGNPPIESVEQYFEEKAARLEQAGSSLKKLAKNLKATADSVRVGNVVALEKATLEAGTLCTQLASEVATCAIDHPALAAAVARPSFLEEIARLGSAAGVSGLRVTEGKLFAFPYVIQAPTGFVVTLGSTKLRSIRPRVVAEEIARARERSAVPEKKLVEVIGRVCEHFASGSEPVGVSLFDVYEFLTLLPGQQAAYTLDDFFAGISKLASGGPHLYKDAVLDFPAPGSGARRVKTMVGADGRTARYSTVRLLRAQRPLGI